MKISVSELIPQRVSALEAQYTQRVLSRHVNKAKSLGTVNQISHQPVRTCNLTFEGEDNALPALPKREKINSKEKAASITQLQQEVKPTRADKRQQQLLHKQVPLPTTNHRHGSLATIFMLVKMISTKLKCNGLATDGEIAGQVV